MTVYAIDPGPTQSALVIIDGAGMIVRAEKMQNEALLGLLWSQPPGAGVLVVEQVGVAGMAGHETFETAFWSGRFVETWDGQWDRLLRKTVVSHLCGSARAGDKDVRQALILRWGPGSEQRATKGTKKKPGRAAGPLGHITGDLWQALGLAVVWRDMATLARRAAEKKGASA